MEKKRYLFLIYSTLAVFATNFIKAYTGSGGYFGSFATEDLFLVITFFVFFFIINLAFSRFFKDADGRPLKTAWIPSLALAIGATYGLWNAGLDLSGLFSGMGLPSGILNVIAPLLVIIFLIFLIKKLGILKIIFVFGGGFLIIGIMDLIYESGWFIIIGVVLLVIGILIKKKGLLKNRFPKKESEKFPDQRVPGERILINEAKRFKKQAKKTDNPSFNGGWTKFINHLKRRGYGRSEDEITANLGMNRNRFLKIFNKYGKP